MQQRYKDRIQYFKTCVAYFKEEKRINFRSIVLPNVQGMECTDDDGYKYLVILEPDSILLIEMIEKTITVSS